MINHDRADRLLAEAKDIFNELGSLLDRGSWNLAIRRSQEVVELLLKALLTELGVEYPRVHDVAPRLVETIRSRGLSVDEAILDRLLIFSRHLTTLRAPAFYHETSYDEREAREAARNAGETLAFSSDFLRRLRT